MQAPPKAVIYVVRGQGVSQTLKKMRESLGTMQIPSIENVDITRDLLRQDAVRKVSGNKDFPIVFVDDVLIGVCVCLSIPYIF
jgi:glutaredoxin